MIPYYALLQATDDDALHVNLEYDLDEIVDPHLVEQEGGVNRAWLNKYTYVLKGHTIQDIISNDVGWYILSSRLTEILIKNTRNSVDLNIIHFTDEITRSFPVLKGFCILGVRRVLCCLDTARTEARWSQSKPRTFAVAIDRGVLKTELIPDGVDIFRLKEYPVYPVVRREIVEKLKDANVSGIRYQKFLAM